MDIITRRAFAEFARRKAAPGAVLLRKEVPVTVQQAGDRTRRFILSTATPDRESDCIAQDGWDLKAYLTNPVVLWDHGYDMVLGKMPVARTTRIEVDGAQLVAEAEFDPADMPVSGPYAEAILRKLDNGSLATVSVGFRPIDWSVPEGESARGDPWWPGIDYLKQELLEWSVVAIPCNPEALHLPPPDTPPPVDPAGVAAAAAEVAARKQAADRRLRIAVAAALCHR